MKKQDEIDEQLAAKKQEDIHMRILAKELEIANIEEESARNKEYANQEIELVEMELS